MAAKSNFGHWRAALLCAAVAVARPAFAQEPPVPGALSAQAATPPAVGHPAPLGRTEAPGVQPTTLPWHGTYLYWDHSLSTNTLGVGQDYQSRDPVYEMTVGLRPRYSLLEDPQKSISVRADLGIVTERTNSDTTTKQGEWSATDFELYGAFSYKLRESKSDLTELAVRLPRVTLPTSKISYDSGKLLAVGVRVGAREDVVLEGRDATFFPNIELIAKAEYGYQFTSAETPTNSNLERIRLDPDGHSFVSDQLSGATFARHSAVFGVATLLHIHQSVLLSSSLDLRPAWKYPVQHDVEVCGVVLTGCTQATGISDPQTRSVLTLFTSEFLITLTDTLGLSLGYANLTAQLGPDGRRRSVFYSPDARFYATLSVSLDHAYSSLTHRDPQTASAAGGRTP
ncbi:MAG: hypothetical protein ABI548_30630 [Polyangiaceae bacterium]